ncbi:MAG: Gfo/Idh/MocA family oxidoreductase [Terracidiphilus sp.]
MIRVGLVAFGMAGRVFHAPLISSVDGLELTAVVERNSDNAAARYPGIRTYRTLDALLNDAAIDLVVVATPSGSHFDVAREALQAGKHVVVDKPTAPKSSEIAALIRLAAAQKTLLIPFHNRRWDGDFLTIQKLLHEETLGRIVHVQSTFDRWNPGQTRRPWKDDPEQGGGMLLDLGTHIADQALALFGKPQAVSGEVRREREGEGANDAFTARLHYQGFTVELGANCLSSLQRPRFHLRGTRGNYWKHGVDPQEAALNQVTRITAADWGLEAGSAWGTLAVDGNGGLVTKALKPVPGDYRLYYAGVRDAVLGRGPAPVQPRDAWRVARTLEWIAQSSEERRTIVCEWREEPA